MPPARACGREQCGAAPRGPPERGAVPAALPRGAAQSQRRSPPPACLPGHGSGFAEAARPSGPRSGWTKGRPCSHPWPLLVPEGHCLADEAGVLLVNSDSALPLRRGPGSVGTPRSLRHTGAPGTVLTEKGPRPSPGPRLRSPDPPLSAGSPLCPGPRGLLPQVSFPLPPCSWSLRDRGRGAPPQRDRNWTEGAPCDCVFPQMCRAGCGHECGQLSTDQQVPGFPRSESPA